MFPPQYKIVHRGYFDMLDLSYIPGVVSKEASKNRPKELVIDIHLPKLKSATNLKLDIFERKVFLESTEDHCNYKLNIKLDYEVDRTKGNARFDKSKKKLIVTLEVSCPPDYEQKEIIKELNDERLKKYCNRHKEKENDMQSRFTMSKDTQFHYQHGPNYVDDDDDFLDYNSEKKTSKENKKQNKSCVEKYTGEPLVYTNDSIIQILQSVQEEKVLHKCPQFTFFLKHSGTLCTTIKYSFYVSVTLCGKKRTKTHSCHYGYILTTEVILIQAGLELMLQP